jgi:Domain of unknown function (DUF4276)
MATKNKNILFVEGESNSPNGDLRQGLSKLLEQKLKGKMPKIILGDGKAQTVKQFKTNKLGATMSLLLVDLDGNESEKEQDLQDYELLDYVENVFYMIQEMESWFLSQPNILDGFYGKDDNGKLISEKIPNKNAMKISNPDEMLQQFTKNTKRGKYHKIRHSVELLKLLNASQLEDDFPDFKKLIEKLQ